MKIQTNAVNVLDRTSFYLQAGLLKKTPAWYNVVARIPPVTKFAREPKLHDPVSGKYKGELDIMTDRLNRNTETYKTRAGSSDRQTAAVHKPSKLRFIEDKLRSLFFQQHPWELSRPKVLVENMGNEQYDWSRMLQLGKPLDGESVVQRTLYLLKSGAHREMLAAYDQARFEFYRLRMQQELEEQIAYEEATMVGAVFKTTAVEHGLQQEQKVLDKWKEDVVAGLQLMSAKKNSTKQSWAEATEEKEEQDSAEPEELKL
ncbi:ADL211Cp [Eremothecium gossypii ATCC 10895]|uniref:Small ribosomal subunit protein mS23 n=1 Tax=Eremothecium gossypii (strain ATCC 10895 / CBS 109.51 / FGSC 9923 / NRRL Y-1056) TaxID=284811 RepID=RT25_EREGS|nr:mitochondrial 37S ribosomal protein RSM25 [Eremothecium gossypii ATCC 10895]Q75AY1.2 RecName: Full=Small ribosomal subunit protein mS23; AltName: Full=37S ribosomal protein S25, mitochondrial [Eremothecium gossypii ATCC 10895]AAS51709.2 ADL211Cp [Eremothecium gossypii ATCC 10895]AEY96006.1 FADL211Cp [Eremothecium gossypii FDAG1]